MPGSHVLFGTLDENIDLRGQCKLIYLIEHGLSLEAFAACGARGVNRGFCL